VGVTHPPPAEIDDTDNIRARLRRIRADFHTARAGSALGYDRSVVEQTTQTVEQQLEEIGTHLAWVRDYL
jgi:hypothetical protein